MFGFLLQERVVTECPDWRGVQADILDFGASGKEIILFVSKKLVLCRFWVQIHPRFWRGKSRFVVTFRRRHCLHWRRVQVWRDPCPLVSGSPSLRRRQKSLLGETFPLFNISDRIENLMAFHYSQWIGSTEPIILFFSRALLLARSDSTSHSAMSSSCLSMAGPPPLWLAELKELIKGNIFANRTYAQILQNVPLDDLFKLSQSWGVGGGPAIDRPLDGQTTSQCDL